MFAIINPSKASSRTLESLSQLLSSNSVTALPSLRNLAMCLQYDIEHIRQSECACLLFARHTITKKRVVMKILHKYKDTRYSLATPQDRQKSQLEALQLNKMFTPEIYLGLARIRDFDRYKKVIVIDDVLNNPVNNSLESNAEYALVMEELPQNSRLDYLLNTENKASLQRYLQLLTQHVAFMHKHINQEPSPISDEDNIQWGSSKQLHRKLTHNLAFADLVLKKSRNGQCSVPYRWVSLARNALAHTLEPNKYQRFLAFFDLILAESKSSQYVFYHKQLESIKDGLTSVFAQIQYQQHFEQRVKNKCIKRCHADLKSTNIWIMPYNDSYAEVDDKRVLVLDAVDFNPLYSNIDILSDFATLVVDVQARTKSLSLAKFMVENYLQHTEQEDEVSKSVLAYYLVEKAIVGAVVSILYDSLPALGRSYLKVAEMRMEDLKSLVNGPKNTSDMALIV